MPTVLGHIFSSGADSLSWWWLIAIAASAVLVVEHHAVAGFSRQVIVRRVRRAVSVVAVMAIVTVAAPAGDAQPAGAVLPDLISDPPRASFLKELNTADGSTRLVATFDGYVHNIGEGALDVVGNPQAPDGMQQRVLVDGEWVEVGAPTIRYETTDGHNHFHLIEAVEYVLWNELQGMQTALGSKVGFCLVDSEQVEPGFNQDYSEELDNFCQEDNPGATSLRMGISPGWRDIYDATTTLQWVDISEAAPGRYWIGAITDPNEEILESDESNNALIFSDRTISVPGFAPRVEAAVSVTGPTDFTLRANLHGTVSSPIFVVEEGPQFGQLSVPVGAALSSPVIRYFPDAGYAGADSIRFSVRDAASPYPAVPPIAELEFAVEPDDGQADDENPAADAGDVFVGAPSTFFETTVGEFSEIAFDTTDAIGQPVLLHAVGLPGGLTVDHEARTISGVALQAGIFQVQLIAVGEHPDQRQVTEVSWIVNERAAGPSLVDLTDRSTARGELTRIQLGAGLLTATLEADGLPPGIEIEPGSAAVSGSSAEAGSYDVTLRLVEDGEVTDTTTFTWTIRPSTDIEFPL